ncbi:uncharacterized protein NEMAJ01_1516 [Nematocida major]|uniref:uncharacterized protein n=1 Tax=Nematocida major TaxID=1912982 RepID=UPI002008A68B|nr:uncharacterized protein NEMAJ01_1516 [Nematocida major]KAH9386620.1 hypothetical protein NEMAJ01_1516 [Nematocida major]
MRTFKENKKVVEAVCTLILICILVGLAIYYNDNGLRWYSGTDPENRRVFKIVQGNRAWTFNKIIEEKGINEEQICRCLSDGSVVHEEMVQKIVHACLDKKANRWFYLEDKIKQVKDKQRLNMLLEEKQGREFMDVLNVLLYNKMSKVEEMLKEAKK